MSQRVAYVTGGMGGIGTAICQRLHKDGFKVIAGCATTKHNHICLTYQESYLKTMIQLDLEVT